MYGRRRFHDFAAELKAHLDIEADRLREEGLDAGEARRQAHLILGNLMRQEEIFYEGRRWVWLDHAAQDIRYSLRQLRRAPAFTLAAAATLALGIGATTAIFTLIHAVLLSSLPVVRPKQLYTAGDAKHVGVYSGMAGDWDIFSHDLYRHLREHTQGFEELAAFQGDPRRIGVRRSGSPDPAQSFFGEYVSGNYFATFGVPAFAGRLLNDADDHEGAPAVAMVTYRAWRDRYGLDSSVIGGVFTINGTPVTIVGAMPPDFFGDSLRSNAPDFWMPLSLEPVVNHGGWIHNPDLHWLYLMGRLRDGAHVKAVEAQMEAGVRQWLAERSKPLGQAAAARIPLQTLHLRPGGSGVGLLRATYSAGLKLLMAIAGFVLLIVCANLANLMLVRGLARRRETSISLALGAARSRVVRQALTESLILAMFGGALGVAIAFAATRTLLASVFTNASYVPVSATPDGVVLAFALVVSAVTGLVFGAAPAWSANRAEPLEALRGWRGATARSGSLPQRSLVVMQAALSLVLVAAAGLLTQSLRNLEQQRFGFSPDKRMAVRIDPNLAGYKTDQLEPLYQKIRDRMARLPGVAGVSYALYSPMSGSNWITDVCIEGQPPAAVEGQNLAAWNRVGPNYFETIGTSILIGRGIVDSDTAGTRHVAVINEAFARRFFPGEDPIGRHFGPDTTKYSKSFEIVGVAADTKYREANLPAPPMYFLPRSQVTVYDQPGTMAFELRSLYATDIVLRLAAARSPGEQQIRKAIADVDPNLTVIRVMSLQDQVKNQFSQETLIARLAAIFGITALLLASIGLYGVTSYSVAGRSKEIGIRVALGADRKSVVGMVLYHAYTLIGLGLALGIPMALGMGRVIGSKLYGIRWYDSAVLAGAVAILGTCGLVATIAPARRAAALDPMETLRGD